MSKSQNEINISNSYACKYLMLLLNQAGKDWLSWQDLINLSQYYTVINGFSDLLLLEMHVGSPCEYQIT